MKRFERIYYLAIIIIEVAIIVVLSFQFSRYKKLMHPGISVSLDTPHYTGTDRLFSFWGTNQAGRKELVHFTAYSTKFYIIVTFSPDCKRCDDSVNNAVHLFQSRELDKDVKIVLVTDQTTDRVKYGHDLNFLTISVDDIFQFGTEVPTILGVNGKGEILFKGVGYYHGIFDDVLAAIYKDRFKKSKKIE